MKVLNITWDEYACWWKKHERALIEKILKLPNQTWKDIFAFLRKHKGSRVTFLVDGFDDTEAIDISFYLDKPKGKTLICHCESPPFGDDIGLNLILKEHYKHENV